MRSDIFNSGLYGIQKGDKMNLENEISQTMVLPLFFKAIDARKDTPFLGDTFASIVLDKLNLNNEKYAQLLKAKMSQAGTIARAWYIDKCVKEFIEKNDNPIVINFGCGLDARSLRVANKKAIFYDSDLEEVMSLRADMLENWGGIQRSWDMFSDTYIDELKEHRNAQFIFVAEGILMYFNKTLIQSFLSKLAKNFVGEVIFDVNSEFTSGRAKNHDALKYEKVEFGDGISSNDELLVEPNMEILSEKLFCDKDFANLFGLRRYMMFFPPFKKAFRIMRLKNK